MREILADRRRSRTALVPIGHEEDQPVDTGMRCRAKHGAQCPVVRPCPTRLNAHCDSVIGVEEIELRHCECFTGRSAETVRPGSGCEGCDEVEALQSTIGRCDTGQRWHRLEDCSRQLVRRPRRGVLTAKRDPLRHLLSFALAVPQCGSYWACRSSWLP